MTKSEKSNIRLKKICERQCSKDCFKSFNKQEQAYLKAQKRYNQYEHELYSRRGFFATVKRLPNGAVDWNSLDEATTECIVHCTNELQRLRNKISRLEEQGLNTAQVFQQWLHVRAGNAGTSF